MVLLLIAFAVAFFAIRAVALWAGIGRNGSIIVSAAICLAFLGGALWHPFGMATAGGAGAPAVAAAAPAAAALPGSAAPLRSLFSGSVAKLTASEGNALGSIDEIRVSPDRRFAFVMGWVVDPATKDPAHGVIFIVDGRVRVNATPYYGVSRPDVATALNSPDAARAGYAGAVIALAGLAPGSHVLESAAVTNDGHYQLVAQQRSFTL